MYGPETEVGLHLTSTPTLYIDLGFRDFTPTSTVSTPIRVRRPVSHTCQPKDSPQLAAPLNSCLETRVSSRKRDPERYTESDVPREGQSGQVSGPLITWWGLLLSDGKVGSFTKWTPFVPPVLRTPSSHDAGSPPPFLSWTTFVGTVPGVGSTVDRSQDWRLGRGHW